jgi:hypothetical protein
VRCCPARCSATRSLPLQLLEDLHHDALDAVLIAKDAVEVAAEVGRGRQLTGLLGLGDATAAAWPR